MRLSQSIIGQQDERITPMITAERKAQLIDRGFYVEDMGKEYGYDWAGLFRWMHHDTQDFQDGEPSDSEDAAWAEASRFDANVSSSYATKE
jgi:hypothetical protein